MGVISNIINKFKFSEVRPLDNKGILSIGDYGNGRIALLRKGKVIDDDLKAVSGNLCYPIDKIASRDMFLAETLDGDFRIYFSNGDLFLDSVKNPTDKDFFVAKEDNIYIVNYSEFGKFVIVPERVFLSEHLSFVDEIGSDGLRMVTQMNMNDVDNYSYYVDKDFRIASPKFAEEQEAGEFKILSIADEKGLLKDVICDANYKIISRPYSEIKYVDGKFIANSNHETFLIDEKGELLTRDLVEYHILRNGCVLATEKDKKSSKLIDRNNEVVEIVRDVIVDKEAGIIAGNVGGRYVMFGYDCQDCLEVNEHVARLIIDKLQGKKLASQYVSYILENEIDMKQTVKAYEYIVSKNLEVDPMNETLQGLNENARARFLLALDRVTSERVKRTQKQIEEMEKESQRILSKAARVRAKQGKASKYKSKVNVSEDEKSSD